MVTESVERRLPVQKVMSTNPNRFKLMTYKVIQTGWLNELSVPPVFRFGKSGDSDLAGSNSGRVKASNVYLIMD